MVSIKLPGGILLQCMPQQMYMKTQTCISQRHHRNIVNVSWIDLKLECIIIIYGNANQFYSLPVVGVYSQGIVKTVAAPVKRPIW